MAGVIYSPFHNKFPRPDLKTPPPKPGERRWWTEARLKEVIALYQDDYRQHGMTFSDFLRHVMRNSPHGAINAIRALGWKPPTRKRDAVTHKEAT